MEFGKHIEKGIWGFADKALTPLYGVAFMLLVIRVIPAEEYGVFFIVQTIFMLVTNIGFSFTIQPMIKWVAEGVDAKAMSATALSIMSGFLIICSSAILVFRFPISHLLDPTDPSKLDYFLGYLPLMFAVSVIRTIASGVLQARFRVKELFFVDAVYFVIALGLVILGRQWGLITGAVAVLNIWIIASVLASVVAYFLCMRITTLRFGWNSGDALKIYRYGRYAAGGTVGNIAQTQFDTFFISAYGGEVGVAQYGVTKTFIRMYDLYTQVIQMLVLPASSKLYAAKDERGLSALIEKSICFSLFAILPAILIFEIFPEVFFHLIYGNRYGESIILLRVLAIIGFVVPFGSVISSVVMGIGKTEIGFAMSLVSLVLSVCIYYISGSLGGIVGIAWGVVVQYVIVGSISYIVLRRIVKFSDRAIFTRTRDIMEYVKRFKWSRGNSIA